MQGQTSDKLQSDLKNAKHDTVRCRILMNAVETSEDPELWPEWNEQILKIADNGVISESTELVKNVYKRFQAYAFNNKGVLANEKGDIDNAMFYYRKALDIQEDIKDKEGMAGSLNNLGFVYNHLGDIPKALEYYHQCLRISEELNNKVGVATVLNNLGLIYVALNDINKGIEYYKKSLKICEEINDREGMGSALNNIGAAHDCSKNDHLAAEYYKKSLVMYKLSDNKQGIATALNNIGMIYHNKKDLEGALAYYQQALKIEKKSEDMYSYSYTSSNIAHILFQQGSLDEALKYGLQSLNAAKAIGYPDNISKAAEVLKWIYENKKEYKEAFEMYELWITMKDSVNNEKSQKAAVKKQLQYAYEKKEAVAKESQQAELDKQKELADEKQLKQSLVIWSVVLGLILVLGFVVYVFKSLNVTRRQKLLIEIKSREVEEKQREILDSIYYARRIQRALMPTGTYIERSLSRLRKS
jgi:tetratricopeptide (TPR) repeat protein